MIKNNKDGTIIIDENNPMLLDDIRMNPEKYIDVKLEIHGFICKENYLEKNQFILGRVIMTCCAADSRIVGIVGEYNGVENLEESENVIVIGRIAGSTIKDENNVIHKIPVVLVEELKGEDD